MLANLQTPSQKHNMKLEDYWRSLRLFSIRDGDQIVRRCHVLIRKLLQDVTLLETPSLTKTKGSEKNKNRLKNTKDVRQATGNRKRCRICNELGHNRETCNKNSNKPERGAENTQPSQFAARVTGLIRNNLVQPLGLLTHALSLQLTTSMLPLIHTISIFSCLRQLGLVKLGMYDIYD